MSSGTAPEALLPTAASAIEMIDHNVLLIDAPEQRLRRPGDLVASVAAFLGVFIIIALSLLGPSATAGVASDVREVINRTAREILLLPVWLTQGALVFLIPIGVIVAGMVQQQWRTIRRSSIAAVATFALSYLFVWAASLLPYDSLINIALGFNIRHTSVPILAPFTAAIAALLSAHGRGRIPQVVRISWAALIFAIALAVLQGQQSLPGAVASVFLGTSIGRLSRYLGGVKSTRANGVSLIQGVLRLGLDPDLVVRIGARDLDVEAWEITPKTHLQNSTSKPVAMPVSGIIHDLLGEQHRIDPLSQQRHYAVISHGIRTDIEVHDGDRQVLGLLSSIWNFIRMRGYNRPMNGTLEESVEHGLVIGFLAEKAGLNVSSAQAVAHIDDSYLISRDTIPGGVSLAAKNRDDLTDEQVASLLNQVLTAHRAGIAHRALAPSNIVTDKDGEVWIVGWDLGELASTDLSRSIDLAQIVSVLSATIGAERTINLAARFLTPGRLAALAPMLQRIILPRETSDLIPRGDLDALRDLLAKRVPAVADLEPEPLRRFTLRKLITISIAFTAIMVLFGTFNFEDVGAAFVQANLWWVLAAFIAGLATYFGAAMGLVAFTPEKLSFRRTILVQIASSIVSLVAPAGVGPAAIDVRYMTQQGIPARLAVATETLVQLTRFLSTVGFLVVVTIASGGPSGGIVIPSGPVIMGLILILVGAGVAISFNGVRAWLLARVLPLISQIRPRIMWVISSPVRLGIGILGNLIQTTGLVAAFGLTLAAFGYSMPLATLAITYLASASAGSLVPSPAGIGPVEVALSSGLTLAGVPSAIAVSATLVFRVVTLWARIPLGWVALRLLQRENVL